MKTIIHYNLPTASVRSFTKRIACISACLIGVYAGALQAQFADPPIPIPISENWTLEMNQAGAQFGYSIAGAGDVNGDGYDDIIVGAPYFDLGQTDEGAAFLYYGSAAGINATPGWSKQSNQDYARFGKSVASAGDVNNDGYTDIIIGAAYYDNGETDEGKVFLYLGSATGLSNTAVWTSEGNQTGAFFGISVAGAGDVDGNGYDDIIISATGMDVYDDGDLFANVGEVFVFLSSASGIPDTASFTATEWDNESNYGNIVASAGDVNGDGYDDVLVGEFTRGWDGPGSAHLYYGSATGTTAVGEWADGGHADGEFFGTSLAGAGDLNGDGYDDVVIGGPDTEGGEGGKVYVYYGNNTGLSNLEDWKYMPGQYASQFGYSVAVSGDINADGYADIIVGAPRYDNGQTDEGVFYVFTGSAAGVPGATSWVGQSNQDSAKLGFIVSGAGDVNGDGFADFMASAPLYNNGQVDEGQVRVYLGSAGCDPPPVVTLDLTDDILCLDDGVVTLSGGLPLGGTYTGTGITGDDLFNTMTAGIGTHSITYTYIAPGGCSGTATDMLTVNENPNANITLGSESLNLCVSSPVVLVANNEPGLTYQWYKNNVAITGQTFLALLAYTTGKYQVQTTNVNGCTKLSAKKKVIHSGCKTGEETGEQSLTLFPNPNSGSFYYVLDDLQSGGEIILQILDINGRVVYSDAIQNDENLLEGSINMELPDGMYVFRILQNDKQVVTRFVVEK